LTAGVIKATIYKPGFNGNIQYVRRDSGKIENDQAYGHLVKVAPTTIGVGMYATGLRNPFDCVYTTNGDFFCTENGPNVNFGQRSTGNSTSGADPDIKDELCNVVFGGYYGHPNRNRGIDDDRQNVYYGVDVPSVPGVFTQCFYIGLTSMTGITEYRGRNFQGAITGNLIFQRWRFETYMYDVKQHNKKILDSLTIDSLDVIYSPGGVLAGLQYSKTGMDKEMIVLGIPDDSSVTKLNGAPYAFDVFPFRADPLLKTPVIITGVNFKPIKSVTVAGAAMTDIVATEKKIKGHVTAPPAAMADQLLHDVVITFSDGSSHTMAGVFKWVSKSLA